MIKVDEKSVKIEGGAMELLTELSLVVHTIYKQMSKVGDKESAKKLIKEQVDLGLMSANELKEQIEDLLDKLIDEDGEDNE